MYRQTDTQTDNQTHMKVNVEYTLSGFREFFLQPIIKDQSNNPNNLILKGNFSNLKIQSTGEIEKL